MLDSRPPRFCGMMFFKDKAQGSISKSLYLELLCLQARQTYKFVCLAFCQPRPLLRAERCGTRSPVSHALQCHGPWEVRWCLARACAALLSSEGVWGAAGTRVRGRWVRVSPQLFSLAALQGCTGRAGGLAGRGGAPGSQRA